MEYAEVPDAGMNITISSVPHYYLNTIFLPIVNQGNACIVQDFSIQFYNLHIVSKVTGVVHLYVIAGCPELIENLKPIPGWWNDRVDAQDVAGLLEAKQGRQTETVHPGS
jgi:hypothetical protein